MRIVWMGAIEEVFFSVYREYRGTDVVYSDPVFNGIVELSS